MNQSKTHYSILGVDQTSTPIEIKNAYRKLSLKYHPDRNKNIDAQPMFQELSLAYEILSDPDKKRKYDMEQQMGCQMGGQMDDIINMMFSGGRGNLFQQNLMRGGPGIQIFRMDEQGPGLENFFQKINQPQKPERIQKQINITIDQAYNGCNIPIEIERIRICGDERTNENETIYVIIPPGIDSNETITIPDKGHCINDSIKGDVRLIIQVINHSPFQRNGLELFYKKTISLKEALLGFSFDLHHLNGKIFTFNNSTQIIHPNFKRKLPDLGMVRDNNHGNLWIEFNVLFPDSLTDQQINLLKDIF